MITESHNKEPKGWPVPWVGERGSNKVCVLLRDGRLFGPFPSVEDARYWCISNEFDGFSTYDLISPTQP